MVNAGFVGENLPLTPVTSIKVAGRISYSPLYTFTPVTQSIVSAEPIPALAVGFHLLLPR